MVVELGQAMQHQPLELGHLGDGDVVIVTGGAMGIGLGIAEQYADAGANLLLVDMNADNGRIMNQFMESDAADSVDELYRIHAKYSANPWATTTAADDQGNTLKEATPATPVRVIGWSGTPDSGATFKVARVVAPIRVNFCSGTLTERALGPCPMTMSSS